MGVLDARLTVASAGAVPALHEVGTNAQRPRGVQVWNCEASHTVTAFDYGNPAEPLRPIRIHAGRNTMFSGRLVVGSHQPLKGLKASVGDLIWQSQSSSSSAKRSSSSTGRLEDDDENENEPKDTAKQERGGPVGSAAKILCSAVRIRYAEPASPGKSWLSPGQFDGLLDTIPAEIPVSTVPPPAKWMFYSWPVNSSGFRAGAVAPLWFTVRVPKNARPGLYEGGVTVEAEGLRPTTVPLRVSVSAWTARDPKDFRLQLFPYSLEESLALYYDVPLWSDKHFELIRKSLALGAEINARQVFANLVADADGPGSNPESLVRWIKQPDGSFKHDFTLFDKYLDTVAKAIGKPHPLQFGWEGSATVTVFDPKSNRVERAGLAALGGDAAVKFWKPVFDEVRRKLDARGWTGEAIFKSSNIVGGPLPAGTIDVASKLWPGGEWGSFSHNGPAEFTGSTTNTAMKVRLRAHVWDGEGAGSIRKTWQPSAYPGCKIYRYHTCGENPPLADMRWRPEELMRYGYDGLASFGLDAFPLKTPVGGYAHRSRSPGTRGFMPFCTIVSLLYPGPDGPVATERYEMLREGLQLTEAVLDVEQAVAQYKAGTSDTGFWRRATRYCQDRNRAFAYGWFGDRFLQGENDAALLDLAGELTPVAANAPAAELAQLVEQVTANPASLENRNLAKRLRAAVASLTPPQLVRLYGCLKAQPTVRRELREIAGLLGAVYRTRCAGDESKLGQLLGDPAAFRTLRAFAQAMADADDPALGEWAWLDGAAFRPSVKGLRGAYHRGMRGWNEERDQGKEFQEFLFERMDDAIAFDSREMPYPDVRQDYWLGNTAIRWTGSIEIKNAGKYTFLATADACVRVWVGDKLVMNVGKAQVIPRDLSGDVALTAGLHPFKVWYYDVVGTSGINSYHNAFFYKATRDLAEMEAAAGFADKAADYRRLADEIREAFNRVLWRDNLKGGARYLDWIGADGKEVSDFYDLCQWPAVAVGLASPEQARQIVATADARLQELEKQYGYPGFACLSKLWNINGIYMSGGSLLAQTYWEIMARTRAGDAQGAAKRLTLFAHRFREISWAGDNGADIHGNMVGGDHEPYLADMVVVSSAVVHGLMGIEPTWEKFTVTPHLPPDWPWAEAEILYKGQRQRVRVEGTNVNVKAMETSR